MKFIVAPTLALAALAVSASGSPSGLNNIPTADTPTEGDYVFQAYSTMGGSRDTDLFVGFKTGFDAKRVKLELGLDANLYPGRTGPLTAQAKVAVPFGENLPTIAVGVANITFSDEDRHRGGDVFTYGVLTHDFGFLRVHGGAAIVDGDGYAFYGIDKTFRRTTQVPAAAPDGKSVRDGKSTPDGKSGPSLETKTVDLFTLRADAIQQSDSSWLYSAGVLVPVTSWFVLEAWGNFPDNENDPSLTLKANFIVRF